MNDESMFDRPSTDWTDDEIASALVELARLMQWKADQMQPVDRLHAVARVLAGERDRRAVLAREVDLIGTISDE